MMDGHDQEDRLRRALRAEAESVVPSAEGLEQIRTRIEARPSKRFLDWWRPALSMVGAFAVAISLVFAIPGLREPIGAVLARNDGSTTQPATSSTDQPPLAGMPHTHPGATPSVDPTLSPTGTANPDAATASACASPSPTGKREKRTPSPDRKCPEPPGESPSDSPTTTPSPSITPTPSPSVCKDDQCGVDPSPESSSANENENEVESPASP